VSNNDASLWFVINSSIHGGLISSPACMYLASSSAIAVFWQKA
jgi:hypothetical protein